MKTAIISCARVLLPAALLWLVCGCAVPVFSDLQSAKTLDQWKWEFTPSYSAIMMQEKGTEEVNTNLEHVQNNFGLQAGVGLTDRIDARLRYEHLYFPDESGDAYNVLGIGVKGAIIPEWLSLYLPIGLALEEPDSWQMHPTVLFTIPAAKWIEINTAAKYLLTFAEGSQDYGAFNFGLGLSTDLDRWVVRPEYGILLGAGDNTKYHHFSIGFTIYPTGRKATTSKTPKEFY